MEGVWCNDIGDTKEECTRATPTKWEFCTCNHGFFESFWQASSSLLCGSPPLWKTISLIVLKSVFSDAKGRVAIVLNRYACLTATGFSLVGKLRFGGEGATLAWQPVVYFTVVYWWQFLTKNCPGKVPRISWLHVPYRPFWFVAVEQMLKDLKLDRSATISYTGL